MKPTLVPYLIFSGNCREAMEYYRSVLGGELFMQTFGEANMAKTPEEKNLIIHASLKNDSLSFMASDSGHSGPVQSGNNMHMSITGTDEKQLTEIFNNLAVGGSITMPLKKEFWGDVFGMVTDRFGVHWMISIAGPK